MNMSSNEHLSSRYASLLTVHSLFDAIAREIPAAIAVQFAERQLTYAELDTLSNDLAGAILARAPDDPIVAISTTRTIEMVVGVLAILRSGKAYLPLDPTYPTERLEQISSDSQVTLVLCPHDESPFFDNLGLHTLDTDGHCPAARNPQITREPSLAYVLYTSGSTGTPKGVCMGHGCRRRGIHREGK